MVLGRWLSGRKNLKNTVPPTEPITASSPACGANHSLDDQPPCEWMDWLFSKDSPDGKDSLCIRAGMRVRLGTSLKVWDFKFMKRQTQDGLHIQLGPTGTCSLPVPFSSFPKLLFCVQDLMEPAHGVLGLVSSKAICGPCLLNAASHFPLKVMGTLFEQ